MQQTDFCIIMVIQNKRSNMNDDQLYTEGESYRPAVLQRVRTEIQSGAQKTIVIIGPSGMGKTYLAQKIVEEARLQHSTVFWFQPAHASQRVESERFDASLHLMGYNHVPLDLIVIDDVLPSDLSFYQKLCEKRAVLLLITCRSEQSIDTPSASFLEVIPLAPLTPSQLQKTFDNDTPATTILDCALATGGIPALIAGTARVTDIEAHLVRHFREIALYQGILYALATGATRVSEIADYCGEPRTKLLPYLNRLITIGWIEKTEPLGSHNDSTAQTENQADQRSDASTTHVTLRRGRYFMTNSGLFNLYGGKNYNRYVALIAQDWLQAYFQERDHIVDMTAWWDTRPTNGERILIDIVGRNAEQSHFVFADCRWDGEFDEIATLKAIARKAGLFFRISGVTHDAIERIDYFLFVKHALSSEAQAYADRMHIMKIVTAEELLAGIS
jgi:hypothetical protein